MYASRVIPNHHTEYVHLVVHLHNDDNLLFKACLALIIYDFLRILQD